MFMKLMLLVVGLLLMPHALGAQATWQSGLDSNIRFYQTTDFGLVLAGTEKSLYAVDGQTGERVWRRSTGKINETAVTPIPNTDLILFTRDLGSRSRLEAIDLLTGARLWRSEKVKGDVMQLAVDPDNDLMAVVLVKDARGKAGENLKRKPAIRVLQLSTGDELWKRDLDSDIEMMPTGFGENIGDVDFTLDNYRAPLLLDGRLFLFYEGSTSYDARTGKEKEREKFKINEDGLALTEADPVFDSTQIYVSGRGKIRAIDRRSGKENWSAGDLGTASEMAVFNGRIFVRTGGQFTSIKDGGLREKGPFGVSCIDTANGKTIWRYKGADKGLTNFAFADANTILIADKDDLITLDAVNGKRIAKRHHKIDKAQFVLINEAGNAVVGGRDEIAAFPVADQRSPELWRVRHPAPGRGVFRVVAGIALRAVALYFRYGGFATSAIGLARTGLNAAAAINSFRWSGLRTHFDTVDLTSLASNAAKNYISSRIYVYGSAARSPSLLNRFGGLQIDIPNATDIRGKIIGKAIDRATPDRSDVQESIFDRIDPARQAEKLSAFFLRRKRVAELRSNYMYFYTDLPRPFDKKGLVGVNVHTGEDARFALVSDPDPAFVTDETSGLLYSANGSRLQAFVIQPR
jgi:outer membrane protein assembly factor BamB